MNWLNNIIEEIKWKVQDFIWAIQDKIEIYKLNKCDVEEIEVKPKKKKAKKKSKNKK